MNAGIFFQLFKVLPQLNEKNKERPLCFSYSVKARALIHAHLSRLPLNPHTLEKDRIAVVRKCPTLIQEMGVCISQLMMLAHAGRISKMPNLCSLENAMKLCPMIVQALWDYKSPLLQLPHVEEDMLKHFNSKKYHVKTLEQLARLGEDDRRMCFRSLTEDQYRNVCKVLANMPLLDVQTKVEGKYTYFFLLFLLVLFLSTSPNSSAFFSFFSVKGNFICCRNCLSVKLCCAKLNMHRFSGGSRWGGGGVLPL